MKRIIWFNTIAEIFFLWVMSAYASPMLAPTLEEAIQRSEYIVIAEYSEYSKRLNQIDYFWGPRADYKVIETLKGNGASLETVHVQYDFHDGSACVAPSTEWIFEEKFMPQKGSRWILFLESKNDKESIWQTYRGDYGRWEATDENLKKIKNQLKMQE